VRVITFNLNTFLQSGLPYGGARPSLFVIEFNYPVGVLTNAPVATSATSGTGNAKSRLTCKAGSLPESSVSVIEVGYFGRRIKVSGERTFQDWLVTVINDEDFIMRAMLEAWSNAINRLESNVRDPTFDNEGYKADLIVRQFAKDGTEIRDYTIIGAWPSLVSAIGLDWDQGNAIEYFTVTWAYDYWLPSLELATGGALQYASAATNTNDAPAN
jgi:hypothetical protein